MEFSYADEEQSMSTDLSQIEKLLGTAVGKVKG